MTGLSHEAPVILLHYAFIPLYSEKREVNYQHYIAI